jgi:hypothetical protein
MTAVGCLPIWVPLPTFRGMDCHQIWVKMQLSDPTVRLHGLVLLSSSAYLISYSALLPWKLFKNGHPSNVHICIKISSTDRIITTQNFPKYNKLTVSKHPNSVGQHLYCALRYRTTNIRNTFLKKLIKVLII